MWLLRTLRVPRTALSVLARHQVSPLAHFDRADLVRDAVGQRRVDGVFGNVTLDAVVVVAFGVAWQFAALLQHLVRRLPGAQYDFADPPHGLAVAAHHADGAQVVQHVFGGDGVLDKTRRIQRVGVDGHLHVGLFRHIQAVADGRRCRAPVFVQFEADGTGLHLFVQCLRQAGVALAQETQVHREGVGRLQHAFDMPGARRRVCRWWPACR